MRGIYWLLGTLMALPAGTVHSAGSDSCRNVAAAEARLVCRIKIRVRIDNESTGACTATAPSLIEVERNMDGHTVFMLFYIRDQENNSNIKFDGTNGVEFLGNGTSGTPPGNVFDRQYQDRRVFLVKNKNPADEKFDYKVNVLNGTVPCRSVDPTIHNKN